MPYREELYRIANHIASAKGALTDEWPWVDEIESDLRELLSRNPGSGKRLPHRVQPSNAGSTGTISIICLY